MLLVSCGQKNAKTTDVEVAKIDYSQVAVPTFVADSAYKYVAEQLEFGYRIPGTKAWNECAGYLANKMSQWCDTVIVQNFTTTLWDNSNLKGKNIIASLDPQNQKRILLGAHWDSRQWADHDPNEDNHKQPLLGANDGASGIGTLMEMARVMSEMRPGVGIDFIFFDVEDQGQPDWVEEYQDNTWCLGSQYWAQNPHVPYYTAVYGVLFDMVGTQNPRFTKEQVSRMYASGITNKIWMVAGELGYSSIFEDSETDPILDDHMYVNQIIGIPMVDIVQNTVGHSFFEYWHTVNDNLDAVDKNSMKIVADVTMKTIYGDYPQK